MASFGYGAGQVLKGLRPFSAPKLSQELLRLPGWKASSSHRNCIERAYVFADFKEALRFMNAAGEVCETMQHHPTWCNTYNKVDVQLCTHDAGNQVTVRDVELAASMNSIYHSITKKR